MMKFIRNKDTGILEIWEKERKIGEVITMGDSVTDKKDSQSNSSTTHA